MTEPQANPAKILDPSVADAGTRRTIKAFVMATFMVGAMTPFTLDVLQDLQLHVAYSKRLSSTVAPHPDRYKGEFIQGTERIKDLFKATAPVPENTGDAGDKPNAVTFLQRVEFVFKSVTQWLRSPSDPNSAANAFYFLGLVFIILLLAATRIIGVKRMMMMLSGMFGPDRFKKLIIDIFFLKGVERQFFPSVRSTAVKNGHLAIHDIARVDLHDIMRVTLGVQGDGRIEAYPESMTVEGRSSYTFCPSITGSGGDYYFNLTHVTVRTIQIKADIAVHPTTTKGHVGRIKFDIAGFKAAAWD